MKNFRVLVVDDVKESDIAGWKVLLEALRETRYLYSEKQSILLDDASTVVNHRGFGVQVLTTYPDKSFRRAVDYLKSNVANYDIFLFDLDLSNFEFQGIGPNKYWDETKELKFGGFGLINIVYDLSLNSRFSDQLAFIYSGAKATEDFRKTFRYIENLVTFRIIDIGARKEDLESTIDAYLRKRQVEVCQRQAFDSLNQLREVVKSWKAGECDGCDDELIPDDPIIEESEKWSLRSLFPKQVNRIQAKAPDCTEAKQFILDILEVDWRKLMCRWRNNHGLLKHPDGMRLTYEQLNTFFSAIEQSDFVATKTAGAPFVAVTSLPEFTQFRSNPRATCGITSALLDRCIEQLKTSWDKSKEMKEVWCENYGILPSDINHIHNIALQNCNKLSHGVPCNTLDSFSADENATNAEITFRWQFQKHFTDFSEDVQKYRIEMVDSMSKLDTGGLPDIAKIAVWRYRGRFEVYTGTRTMIVTRVGNKFRVDFKDSNEPPCYKITIEKP